MAHYDYSHGMEVEQGSSQAPREVVYGDEWHRDGSGPLETDYGSYKQVKSIMNAFKRDHGGNTWSWHNETMSGAGCGSHVHLNVGDGFDDELEAWTVTWNAMVELTPFMLPMFCADWSQGFRSSVDRWAAPNTTRYSQSTMADMVRNPRAQSRSYSAVTMNGADYNGKPLTVEFRMNEAHPSQACVGLLFLRRMAGRMVEAGWSPKLSGDRSGTLSEIYSEVYSADDPLAALGRVEDIEFQDGRGIAGQEEFDTALDVFRAILSEMGTDSGNYKDRMKALTLARIDCETDLGPEDLADDEIWRVDEDTDFWQAVDDRSWDEAERLT